MRFSVLAEFFCGFAVLDDFFFGFAVSNIPQCPPPLPVFARLISSVSQLTSLALGSVIYSQITLFFALKPVCSKSSHSCSGFFKFILRNFTGSASR